MQIKFGSQWTENPYYAEVYSLNEKIDCIWRNMNRNEGIPLIGTLISLDGSYDSPIRGLWTVRKIKDLNKNTREIILDKYIEKEK